VFPALPACPSAAGGGDSKITLRLPTEDIRSGSTLLDVVVEGLMGGHSGINIHEDRGACSPALTMLLHSCRNPPALPTHVCESAGSAGGLAGRQQG
jgi:hypothetical protein